MSAGSNIDLRPFTTADLEVVAPWLEAEGLGVPGGISHKLWGHRLSTDDRIVCRVATEGGRQIGFFRLDLGPDGTAEISLMVSPDRRRCGIGRHLLAAARAEASRLDVSRLVAAVRRDNAEALAFFLSARFSDSGLSVPGFVHLWCAVAPQRSPLEAAPSPW